MRRRYLHVALKPFILPVDGETTQIIGRGIVIRAAEPVQEALIEGPGAQLWSKSETMHISLRIPDAGPPELSVPQSAEARETTDHAERLQGRASGETNTEPDRESSYKTLQRQVENLAAALKEVQARIAGQSSELESVKAEIKRLQDQHTTGSHERAPITSPLE